MPGLAQQAGELFQMAGPVGEDQAVAVLTERGEDVRDDLPGALLISGQVPVDGRHAAGTGRVGVAVVPVRSRVNVQHRGGSAGARERALAGDLLTAQEAQVARLARDGLSNPEIGARLFISRRTAQYHLSSVFTKLGISSRGQLHRVLPSDPTTLTPRQPLQSASCPAGPGQLFVHLADTSATLPG